MDLCVKLAERNDFDAMIRLADLTLPDRMNLHELKKYFELFPELIFKAMNGDQLIGFACAGVDMYRTTGWLLFNNVLGSYQGNGIGKRLIQVRLDALQQIPEVSQILVTVNENNTPSLKALFAFGFQIERVEHNYYGPGKHRSLLKLPVYRNMGQPQRSAHILDGLEVNS
jgi:ribosomal protein S18 acetylase RimI-like enzyme